MFLHFCCVDSSILAFRFITKYCNFKMCKQIHHSVFVTSFYLSVLVPVVQCLGDVSYCYASGDVFTTVADVYGSVEASVVLAGFVSHGNENPLCYPNKPPAESSCNCQFCLLEQRTHTHTPTCSGRPVLSLII